MKMRSSIRARASKSSPCGSIWKEKKYVKQFHLGPVIVGRHTSLDYEELVGKTQGHFRRRKPHQASYNVAVRSDSITLVRDQPFREWTFLLPEGLRALPGSCSGLEWIQGEGIQMRLQLEADDDDDEDGDQEEGGKREEDEKTGDSFLNALEDLGCAVFCSRCGAPLVQPSGGFQKVLPLPSGDWGDMAADMWCCKSKVIAEETGKTRPLQLNPEEGSVMVDDLHLLVNSRMLVRGSVDIEVKKMVRSSNPQRRSKSLKVLCQRCGNILGSVDNAGGSSQLETTKLYRYAVCIQHKGKQLPHALYNPLQQTICSILVSLFKNQMTFKYIIEDEEEHKPRLLIWLLGIDTRLLCGGALPGSKLQPGCPTMHQLSPPEGGRLEIQLKSQPIVKVLYQTCSTETGMRLGQEWNKDLMVHGITLTMEACLQLGLLLATSTLQAPPSMRQMKGFLVGSLKFR